MLLVYFSLSSVERVSIKCSSGRAKVVGALVCVGGAILLSVYKGMPLFHFPEPMEGDVKIDSGFGRGRWAIGCVALFAGTICWSSWFILQTSIGKRYPCQYSSTAIMALFSAIQAAILSSSIDRELSIWILRKKSDILIVLFAVSVYIDIYYYKNELCFKILCDWWCRGW